LEQIRLQKILSNHGYGSRRDCELIISSGRVKINGKTAKLGDRGNPEADTISIDGKILSVNPFHHIYIAFNKPKNVLSEIKPSGKRKTAREFISIEDYLHIVGRLDYRSEGLILFTNNGELANRLTHPRYEHEKEYEVQLDKRLAPKHKSIWENGVVLDNGYKTLPAEINELNTECNEFRYRIVMREGKKRQIRDCARILGYRVSRLIRVRIGSLELGNLASGEWRNLTSSEEVSLLTIAGLK